MKRKIPSKHIYRYNRLNGKTLNVPTDCRQDLKKEPVSKLRIEPGTSKYEAICDVTSEALGYEPYYRLRLHGDKSLLRRVTEVRCMGHTGGLLAHKTYYTCTESKINELHAPSPPQYYSKKDGLPPQLIINYGPLVEVHLQSSSTSVLNRHKWLASNSCRFIFEKISPGIH